MARWLVGRGRGSVVGQADYWPAGGASIGQSAALLQRGPQAWRGHPEVHALDALQHLAQRPLVRTVAPPVRGIHQGPCPGNDHVGPGQRFGAGVLRQGVGVPHGPPLVPGVEQELDRQQVELEVGVADGPLREQLLAFLQERTAARLVLPRPREGGERLGLVAERTSVKRSSPFSWQLTSRSPRSRPGATSRALRPEVSRSRNRQEGNAHGELFS